MADIMATAGQIQKDLAASEEFKGLSDAYASIKPTKPHTISSKTSKKFN
ncbi:hypothetical protein [Secundilactobacillus oryzae]|nr:hypothetical protein [Secundilactobacillus oryzae]